MWSGFPLWSAVIRRSLDVTVVSSGGKGLEPILKQKIRITQSRKESEILERLSVFAPLREKF
jgi:hypothetical protein